jgi:hypothetical protein
MRAGLAISALVHAAIVLGLLLAPGSKPFDPAHADAILVELIPPPDSESPQPAAGAQDKTNPKAQQAVSSQNPAELAARLAWMFDAPANLPSSLAAPPSETKSRLPADLVTKLKAQVRKCFVPLADPPDAADFTTDIRIALKRDGTLAGDPEMVFAPGSTNGHVMMERARQAVRQCQPYGFLPADKYADWRVIEMVFAFDGPADDATASTALEKASAFQQVFSGR